MAATIDQLGATVGQVGSAASQVAATLQHAGGAAIGPLAIGQMDLSGPLGQVNLAGLGQLELTASSLLAVRHAAQAHAAHAHTAHAHTALSPTSLLQRSLGSNRGSARVLPRTAVCSHV